MWLIIGFILVIIVGAGHERRSMQMGSKMAGIVLVLMFIFVYALVVNHGLPGFSWSMVTGR